ncbi:MAG: hypothetical protein WEB37_00300 [Bacteroidota bacterium]
MIHRRSISKDLQEAAAWLKAINIDFENSRFAQYANHLKRAEGGQLDQSGHDSAIEASDLYMIYRGLSRLDHPNLHQKLKIFVESGPLHSSQERPGGATGLARNTALELLIASQFALAGYDLDFNTTSDVAFRDGRTMFHVECKRPFTYNGVKKNIERAYSQLRHRYRDSIGSTARGLVVLSIAKFSNPMNQTLSISDDRELVAFMSGRFEEFLRAHQRLFYRNHDERTMAVLAYLQIAVAYQDRKGTGIHRQFAGMYLSTVNPTDIKYMNPDRLYFHEIVERINRSNKNALRN